MKAEEARLNRKFGRMWHTSSKITDPHLADLCHCCHERPTQRIEVNIHGHVVEYDVCDEHAKYDGIACDEIPERKSICYVTKSKVPMTRWRPHEEPKRFLVMCSLCVCLADGSFETVEIEERIADALVEHGLELNE